GGRGSPRRGRGSRTSTGSGPPCRVGRVLEVPPAVAHRGGTSQRLVPPDRSGPPAREERAMHDRNFAAIHRRQAERLGSAAAVRFKRDGRWHDLTWEQYRADALACAAALADAGVRPGDRVAVLSE